MWCDVIEQFVQDVVLCFVQLFFWDFDEVVFVVVFVDCDVCVVMQWCGVVVCVDVLVVGQLVEFWCVYFELVGEIVGCWLLWYIVVCEWCW